MTNNYGAAEAAAPFPQEDNAQRGISACTLKVIAIITMLIDHVAAALILRALVYANTSGSFVTSENYDAWYTIYYVMRGIGRMAFPVFCFFIVEGFQHTRSVPKYALRLLIFAIISEVPFDVALYHSWFSLSYNNVYFTLLLGLLAIWGMDFLEQKLQEVLIKSGHRGQAQSFSGRNTSARGNTSSRGNASVQGSAAGQNNTTGQRGNSSAQNKNKSKSLYGKKWASEIAKADDSLQKKYKFVQITGNLAIALTAMLVAEYVLCTDYGAVGVLTILIMYLMREKPMAGFAVAVVFLGLFSDTLEFAALLMLIPLHLYNGTRGRQIKYLFYAFYPVHLTIIALVGFAMGMTMIY